MSDRTYLRPTAFVDAPFGLDGQVLRLAGGLIWFSAVEIIAVKGGGRVSQRLVPVERIETELDDAGRAVLDRITAPRAALTLGQRIVRLDQPQTMAILNVTPDSFSDGGKHVGDPEGAAATGVAMAAAGAAIIDVGGESTRPGAASVWEGDEIARVVPVIERLARAGVALSSDTRKAAVMSAALAAGASLINDVSALTHDPEAMAVIAKADCPVVLMHHRARRKTCRRTRATATC
jgi:dihydropteroate synthase